MRLGELDRRDLATRLERRGVDLDTGPFVVRLETPIPELVDELHALYRDYPLDEGGGLADFHAAGDGPAGNTSPPGTRRD